MKSLFPLFKQMYDFKYILFKFTVYRRGGLESAKRTLAFALCNPKRRVSGFRGKKGKQETKRETEIYL